MKSQLLLTLLMAASVAQAKDYFSDVDHTIESESLTKQTLVSERYYRVIARLSVYALYCDAANKLGYSQRFHETWVATSDLQSEAEAFFGGTKPAYNKLETERNEESLRFVQSRDRATMCSESFDSFVHFTSLSEKQFRAALSTPAGSL